MKNKIFITLALILTIAACKKKAPDTPLAVVPERIEITPNNSSILMGETMSYTLKFYDNTGQMASIPSSVSWSSSNASIVTISQQGVATAIGTGQVEIKATYNNISGTAFLNVVDDNLQLATIMLMPTGLQELTLGQTFNVTALGKTVLGNTIPGITFSWLSDNPSLVLVDNSGMITGMNYGTANVTASSSGVQSSPLMVQVIRKGGFSGFSSTGMAKLKIENNVLKLQTSADFSVMTGPPDLRIYLGNNSSNINGAIEIASLNQRSGAQSWNVSAPTSITQYRYAIVWCMQFGGIYGVADLGN